MGGDCVSSENRNLFETSPKTVEFREEININGKNGSGVIYRFPPKK